MQPHAKRIVIFGGYNYNSGWGLYDTYRNPQDLPGGGRTAILWGLITRIFRIWRIIWKRVDDVKREFADVHDIPVYLGEFGYEHRESLRTHFWIRTVKSRTRLLLDSLLSPYGMTMAGIKFITGQPGNSMH